MAARIVMLVDLDYFYARVEENENPELRGRPVVIGMYSGRTETSGAVATANYEARNYGVKAGIPLFRAKQLLKDTNAVFIPARLELYDAVSSRIMSILRDNADSFEQVSVDEAFLEVTKRCEGDWEKARLLAMKIKKEILEKENVTCSVGIGPNKLISKMASKLQKPNGLTAVVEEDFDEAFGDKPVKELYGIGPKTRDKLAEMSIETIRELATFAVKELQREFGTKLGTYFHEAANGRDADPVEEKPPQQFSRIVTLKRNSRDVAEFADVLEAISKDAVDACTKAGFTFRNVGIIAIFENLETKTRSKTIENEMGAAEVARAAAAMFKQIIDENKMALRRIGIRVASLEERGGKKGTLQKFFQR